MVTGIINYFYPDIKKDEITKFSLLGTTFAFIIGAYWIMRLLKDTIFFKMAFPEELGWAASQGRLFQPQAKMLSVVVVFVAVLIYSKLVDRFKKESLFYILCTFYGILFSAITGVLFIYQYFGPQAIGRLPLAVLGWAAYFAIESFGSIVPPLFWAYTVSITMPDSAKAGAPFIIAAAQLAAVGGSILNIFAPQFGSIWPLFLIATAFVLLVIPTIKKLVRTTPAHLMQCSVDGTKTEKKQEEGMLEGMFKGLILIFSRPYIFGIFIVSTLYEVVGTITEYQMKSQADAVYKSAAEYARFTGIFGTCVNGLSFLVALLGFSYIMKNYGLRFCLLLYPIVLLVAMSGLYGFFLYGAPTSVQLLWASFAVMVVAKGLAYAVNNPTKEMMYIPTSKDTKFKAKGFIDSFGGRVSKMAGSGVTDVYKNSLPQLMLYGTLFSFGLISVWIVFAIYVGMKNASLIKNKQVVD